MKNRTAWIGSLSATALLLMCLTAPAQTANSWEAIDEVVGPNSEAGPCPQISWPLHLVGVKHVMTHNRIADGTQHTHVFVTVHGTATDVDGNEFVFSYGRYDRLTDPLDYVVITDHFNLEGKAGHVRVSFVLLVRTDENGELIVDWKPNGDIACDPI